MLAIISLACVATYSGGSWGVGENPSGHGPHFVLATAFGPLQQRKNYYTYVIKHCLVNCCS